MILPEHWQQQQPQYSHSRRKRRSTSTITGGACLVLLAVPSVTTSFQIQILPSRNPLPRAVAASTSRPSSIRHSTRWTLSVSQQDETEATAAAAETTPTAIVDNTVFFNDFDYDYYQTTVDGGGGGGGDATTIENEQINSPSSTASLAYCAIDPLYNNLSSPYTTRMDSKSTFVEYTEDGLCIPAGPLGRFKEEIANLLKEPAVEIIIASVILLNSLLVALSTLNALSEFMPMILFAEIVVSTIFVVDFGARWFSSCRDSGKFVLDPQFGIDVLVVILPLLVTITPDNIRDEAIFLPSALSKPSELFNLRLLRVLRLQRFLKDLDTFERFMDQIGGMRGVKKVQEWQLKLARVVSSLFTLLSVVSGLIYTAENAVNPDIDNYFDALYFSLTTLTTVGFGDVSPVTWQGKLIVCASIVLGVAIVPAQAASLVEALLDREKAKRGSTTTKKKEPRLTAPETILEATLIDGVDSTKNEMLALDTSTSCRSCGASFHWSAAQFCYSCGEEL